tara:strand:+ start:531 stop:1022 length:492 start_codon:yes stop_codon:yes gene_type:complete
MRHYEIVFLVHPDQSDQTQSILSKFSSTISNSGGVVHRSENIGNKRLSYPIQDQFKASFGLMNVECNAEVIEEIKKSFKFNDLIIRDLILVTKKAHKQISALSSQTDEEEELELNLDSERASPQKKEDLNKSVREEKKLTTSIIEDSKEKPTNRVPELSKKDK